MLGADGYSPITKSKLRVWMLAFVTFYKRIAKQTNLSFYKKPREGPMHGTMHLAVQYITNLQTGSR